VGRPLRFAAIAVVATILAACGGGGGGGSTGSSSADLHVITGTWYLTSSNSGGVGCTQEFSDVGAGQVNVTDVDGKKIGEGSLTFDPERSTAGGFMCVCTFTVSSVPTATAYRIQVLTYGFPFTFDELQELGWKVELSSTE
jgi:hypothetical protein